MCNKSYLPVYSYAIGSINVIIAISTLVAIRLVYDNMESFIRDTFEDLEENDYFILQMLVSAFFYIMVLIILSIGLTSALLIYATYERRSDLMVPWLLVWSIIICLLVTQAVWGLLSSSYSGIIDVICIIILCAIFYAVYLLYRKTSEENA